MRAAVLQEPNAPLKLADIEEPSPGPGEVMIKVAGCGVCHTDLHVMKGEVAFPTPCVLGHEISGTIEGLGPGVDDWEAGSKVVSSFMMPCGKCSFCVRGDDDLCELFYSYNRLRGVLYDGTTRLRDRDDSPIWMYSMGGLSEYCIVPVTDVFALPDGLGLRESAILGCSTFTSLGAVKNAADLRVGESVAVVATGGVGLNIIQMAAAFGASKIVAIDIQDDKLEKAREMGASDVVNSAIDNASEAVMDITNGRGVDVAFEALGNPVTVSTALSLVGDGGRVVLVGIAPSGVEASFDITRLVRRKIRVLGSYGAKARTDMPLLLSLVSQGRVKTENLITERYPLGEAQKAYDRLNDGHIVGRALIEM